MSGDWSGDEFDDDSDLDDEGPQDGDLDDGDNGETIVVPCPECGAEIPEFADYCPHCHTWVAKGGKRAGPSVAMIAVIVIAIGLILVLLLR